MASAQPSPLVSIADYAAAARECMSSLAYEYVASGAGDECTMRWNEEAFARLQLRSRVLVDVSAIDSRITLFGDELAHPILLAPTAYHRLTHPDGELATARGAGDSRAAMVVSTLSTTSIEDIAAVATAPLWFQLYVQRDRGFTAELVRRAEASGCRALCVTVDLPVMGVRYRETRAAFALPEGLERANLRGIAVADTATHHPTEGQIYSELLDPTVTWKDVEWLRSITRMPVVLKGILDPEDAALAFDAGAAGIVVSNHGGRTLDTVPATIDALPAIRDAVGDRGPLLLDGGIRRGADILKALASGASAVMIGRPYLYGLAVGGAAGVAHVVTLLRLELETAMALTGRSTIAALDRGIFWDSVA